MVEESKGDSLMPNLEISYSDLCKLVGKKINKNKLTEVLMFAKCEVEGIKGDNVFVEIKDTNRPDLWSAEGISREIQGRITNKKGLPKYSIKKSNLIVNVDKKTKNVRPYTVCAVVKKVKLNDKVLSQLVQLQEKVSGIFGRNRKEIAIGVYDLDRIKPPIRFTTFGPKELKFTPIGVKNKMSLEEILKKHPKGKEYGHLLKGHKQYPIFIDSKNEVLSMPPIINSDFSGKVTEKTKNIFVECTGYDLRFLYPALNVVVCALADRGGKIESVKVVYSNKKIITPDLEQKKFSVNLDLINRLSGLNVNSNKVVDLLKQARYDVRIKGEYFDVHYPAYRQDIMHQVDVIEDVILSYGYGNMDLEENKITSIGKMNEIEERSYAVGEVALGLGLQEILSYSLTNKSNLFDKMNVKDEKIVEIENPVSENWNVFRSWLIPNLLEFLSNNKHVEYPQKIFEIGDAIVLDSNQETKTKDLRKMAVAIADKDMSYEEISSILNLFLSNIGVKYKLKKTAHKSFIDGRVADIIVNGKTVGFLGEINPVVLENWKLEMPVAALEIDISKII